MDRRRGDNAMFDYLTGLLTEKGATFRVIEHPPEGNSQRVAEVRGTTVSQGAKAMVCRIRGADFHVIAVVPGDRRVDLKKVASVVGFSRARFMATDETVDMTGCAVGAIPPFPVRPDMRVIVDPELSGRHQDIAFNAGRLDASIVLATSDYLRIVEPLVAPICE
ncbi:YbaK/EbsC family protein [Burkholderia territorii]|uniref:YbaK/EbsC family protein n=1 Tax=Burkholderia territorii TaxID=1503055 RepID=UPI001E539DA4|nr:YbaK/EbsC family protein [Burkholderia territorii]